MSYLAVGKWWLKADMSQLALRNENTILKAKKGWRELKSRLCVPWWRQFFSHKYVLQNNKWNSQCWWLKHTFTEYVADWLIVCQRKFVMNFRTPDNHWKFGISRNYKYFHTVKCAEYEELLLLLLLLLCVCVLTVSKCLLLILCYSQ